MPATSPDFGPSLPDGSSPPDGAGRQLLAVFDHMSPGQRKPVGRSRLRSYLMQTTGGPVSEPELEQILGALKQRGLVVDAPHPGPTITAPKLPDLPGIPQLQDVYAPGEPQLGEPCYATTDLGAKAAHMCRTLLGHAVAAWRLGPHRVHDQVLTALQPSFPADLARIDAVCCCTPTDEVRGAVSLNVSWGLLRSEGENAYILTSEGEGRLQQVLRELPSLGAKSAQAEPSPSAVASQTTASPGISRRTAVVLGEVLNEAFTIRAPDPEDPLELVRQVQGELLYDFLIEREYDESFCNRMRALQGERAVKDAIIQIHTGSFWSDNGRKDSGRKTLGQQLLWKLARDILRDPKQQRLYYKAGYTEPLLQSLKQDGFVFADGELIPQPQDDLHSFGNDSSEVQDNPPATKVEPGARSIDPLGEGSMAGMTEDAKDIVRWLREQYLVAGFPDHHGWKFSPAKSNRTAIAELRAHGLIEVFGTGGRNWTLTDVGQRLLLRMGADAANGTMPQAETEGKDMQPDPQKVFVIHGRNLNARKELGTFLRSLGLTPLNFGDLRGKMGGTPTVAEIVERGMAEAQGIVALFTAEEYSAVKPDYRYAHDKPDDIIRWQSRPNVIFEAGMAFGKDKKRVVFVLLGSPILFSDVAGIHGLRPDNKPEGDRSVLRQTLKSMGCRIEEDSSDWMTSGDLEGCIESLQGVGTRDPFG